MHVCVIFGTRPEAIKLAPVIRELRRQRIKVTIVITSQHTHLLQQVLAIFKIKPDFDLKIMKPNQTLDHVTSAVIKKVYKLLPEINPDITIVQGDTTSAFSSSLASFYRKIPVGHVEAGLRTYDIFNPFPEEINRRLIAPLCKFNFAPTRLAMKNLIKEGINRRLIYLTGNTVVDALQDISRRIKRPSSKRIHSIVNNLKNTDKKIILVTTHRRESFGDDMKNILLSLKDIAVRHPDCGIIFPVHPNPHVTKPAHQILSGIDNVYLVNPVPYSDLVYIMKNTYLILTDSGGIQEEAPAFGIPVLVLRKTTERPEGVKAGVAKLVGTEREKITRVASRLLSSRPAYEKMSRVANPYGDGKASYRIVQVLTTGKLDAPFEPDKR